MTENILASLPDKSDQNNSVFDVHTGYKYRANMEIGPKTDPFPLHYRTNNHGLIARAEFPLQKPDDEFRIGFVGDSALAGVMTTIRWPDIVEDRLNASETWRRNVNGRRTLCINFGLDGIGTVQFSDVVEHMVKPFDVDLLVVNMIREDVIRRPYHRGYKTEVSRQQIDKYVGDLVGQLPWFGIYPEVLAVVTKGDLGLKPRLTPEAVAKTIFAGRLYGDPAEAAEVSAKSLRMIMASYPDAVFLLDPTYKEYTKVQEPEVDKSFAMLKTMLPQINWVDMKNDYLPQPSGDAETESWFNTPHDMHKNELGTKIYGNAVADYLIETAKTPQR
ncbi:MAG: hypothetical protein AB7H77_00045 [Bdellovibrionales bacterium]